MKARLQCRELSSRTEKCDIGLYIKGSQNLTLDKLSFAKSEESRIPFLKGGEISKLTYVEDRGGKFYDENGQEGDALQIMAENGFNFARIRVLNNPGKVTETSIICLKAIKIPTTVWQWQDVQRIKVCR